MQPRYSDVVCFCPRFYILHRQKYKHSSGNWREATKALRFIRTLASMGIVIRQSIRSTVWAYFGVLLGAITTLWLYPHFLTSAQIGLTTGVLLSLASILSQLGLAGTQNTAYYYSAKVNEHPAAKASLLGLLVKLAFYSTLALLLLYVAMQSIFVHWYQAKSALFLHYFYATIPFTITVVAYNLLEAFVRSQKQIVFTNFTREVLLRVINILALVALAMNWISFDFFVWIFVFAYGALFIALWWNHRKDEFMRIRFDKSYQSIIARKEIIQYSLYNVLAGGAWSIANSIDSLMLAGYSLSDAGIYRLAYFICSVVQMPQKTISQILLPLVADAWHENDKQKLDELYKKSAMQLIIAGSFLILLLVLLVDAFLAQLPAEYHGAKWVVLLLASSKLIDMATSINGEIIQTSKYYKFNLYLIVALMIFTIFANAYFIPRYGIIGAALATTMVNVLFNVAKYLYVWFKVRIQPFTIGIIWVLLMSTIIAFALIWLTQGMNIWWSAFLRFSLASVAFIVFLLMSRVSPEIHGIWVKQVLPRLGFKNK